ncbi:bacitracin ABC transporter permease [Paenibacillus sp. FSL H7-0357]|uniref:ABC transporter permease n=1 Tax=Paenibacillus sp. FSL H7-0357 TaxID=1536774 RepID=UPI0004F91651|nr:ABC transporter permease [Paenibacillus sp. FSL H7-0357]AIQ18826.1 bacitracin ABC transporter permease [Paenibacillus sp. FSL H7-0357]
MLRLMKIEWKRNNLAGYSIRAVISMMIIFGMVAGMAVMSNAQDEPMFLDFTAFMSLANIFIRVTFVVFSGIIISRLVIDEYKNKTIQLLFTYPIQRKKVMQAKLMIVLVFCFTCLVISTFIIEVLTVLLNPAAHFFETAASKEDVLATFPAILMASAMTAGLSLIPLSFGMRKKSTATTITSSVILGILLNSMISDGSSSVSMFQFIGVPIVFCLLGLALAYLSYRKIDRTDVA